MFGVEVVIETYLMISKFKVALSCNSVHYLDIKSS